MSSLNSIANIREIKKERGWRDIDFSVRHKTWGFGCPTVDIDLLIIEYSHAEPKAIVEYKNEYAHFVDFNNSNYRAIAMLCTKAGIPFFNCKYSTDYSWFDVTPLNQIGREMLPIPGIMTELEWVTFLYKLRGTVVPESVKEIINDSNNLLNKNNG